MKYTVTTASKREIGILGKEARPNLRGVIDSKTNKVIPLPISWFSRGRSNSTRFLWVTILSDMIIAGALMISLVMAFRAIGV